MLSHPYVWLALVAAALFGLSTTIDKLLVSRHIDHSKTILFTSGTLTFAFACAVALWQPIALPRLGEGVLLASAGVLSYGGLYWFFRAIAIEDATAVAPLRGLAAVVGAALAFVTLGEVLPPLAYAGAALVVGGVALLAVTRASDGVRGVAVTRAFGYVVLAAGAWGAEAVLLKAALATVSFWSAFFWARAFGLLAVCVVLVDADVRAEVRTVLAAPRRKNAPALIATEGCAAVGLLVLTRALDLGPVGIVRVLEATDVVFVFLFVGLAQWAGIRLEERTSRVDITKKVVALVFVTVGVGLVRLG